MIPILKNTAPGFREPGDGHNRARAALISTENIPQSTSNYNLDHLLPVATNSYTSEDINRVKNAIIGYCLAMAEGDTETMTLAAGMLQRLPKQRAIKAVTAAYNQYEGAR